jgi:hypothetical protein
VALPRVEVGSTLFWGGYIHGDLALRVGIISYETVKYGHAFCGTCTEEGLLWRGPDAIVRLKNAVFWNVMPCGGFT